MLNYRELLVRYLAHVIESEGTDFMDQMLYNAPILSKEDREELQKLSDEAQELLPK